MRETPELKLARDEDASLTYEAFRPQLDEKGDPVTAGPNNMWMNVLIALEDADILAMAQMKGQEFIDRVTDPEERETIERLIREHTDAAEVVMHDAKKRREFILTAGVPRLYEIYKILRKYGVTNRELFT